MQNATCAYENEMLAESCESVSSECEQFSWLAEMAWASVLTRQEYRGLLSSIMGLKIFVLNRDISTRPTDTRSWLSRIFSSL